MVGYMTTKYDNLTEEIRQMTTGSTGNIIDFVKTPETQRFGRDVTRRPETTNLKGVSRVGTGKGGLRGRPEMSD